MARVSQPIIGEDKIENAWKLEVTNAINNQNIDLVALLTAIAEATDFDDLKRRLQRTNT